MRRQVEPAGVDSRLELVYPRYVQDSDPWQDERLREHVLRVADAEGFARTEKWSPGASTRVPCEYEGFVTQGGRTMQGNASVGVRRILSQGDRASKRDTGDGLCVHAGYNARCIP